MATAKLQEAKIRILWTELETMIKEFDIQHPKKFIYPKDSIRGAIEQAIKELK